MSVMVKMEEALRVWLVESGFHQATTPEPMQRDLGSAGLWSFTAAAGQPPLVVRVFAAAQVAEREHAAMVAAGSGGVPVPECVMRGVLRGQADHVLTFVPVAARRGSGPGPAAAPRLPPCQRAHAARTDHRCCGLGERQGRPTPHWPGS